jgi:F-type H+-transporting ATPase subunit delta
LHFQGLAASGQGSGNCLKRERGVQGEGSIVSGMAGRYATALFELAREERAIDAVKADLDRFDALLAESPDLARLVRSPVFSAEQQAKALNAVLEAAGIVGLAAKFLNVLAANRRLFAIGTIIRDFRKLVAHHKGEVIADVTLAEQPSDAQLTAIKDALHAVTSRDVRVEVKVEPAIIGGLIVKLGSRMVDSSLRTKLRSLKHAMKEVS